MEKLAGSEGASGALWWQGGSAGVDLQTCLAYWRAANDTSAPAQRCFAKIDCLTYIIARTVLEIQFSPIVSCLRFGTPSF